jgi:hypothetical protein
MSRSILPSLLENGKIKYYIGTGELDFVIKLLILKNGNFCFLRLFLRFKQIKGFLLC